LAAQTIPHLYFTNAKSGVNEIQMTLGKEISIGGTIPFIAECPSLGLVSTYKDGTRVFSKGSMKATFSMDFRFELLELSLDAFDEYFPRGNDEAATATASSSLPEVKTENKRKNSKHGAAQRKQSLIVPEKVVNEFGVTVDTMRILEITDHFTKLLPIIQFSARNGTGPAESLAAVTQRLSLVTAGPKQINQFPTAGLAHYPTNHIATTDDSSLLRASASPRSIKRRTSIAISPGDSGLMGSPADSPSVDELHGGGGGGGGGSTTGSGVGTPTLNPAMINSNAPVVQGMGTGLGLSFSGQLAQGSPSMTSPPFTSPVMANSPLATGTITSKSAKRIRTA
ncbi:hypothetical protein BGZ76_006480, partial [Entomortierella beljakovae]